MASVNDLKAKVEANPDLKESVATLVTGLADQLDGLTHDPVAIKALATELRTNTTALKEAVVANTAPTQPQQPQPTKGPTPTAQTAPGRKAP